jgi:hypothetical protein
MGFMDVDEFIVPFSAGTIPGILSRFDNRTAAVYRYWRGYATDGCLTREKGLVIERFRAHLFARPPFVRLMRVHLKHHEMCLNHYLKVTRRIR